MVIIGSKMDCLRSGRKENVEEGEKNKKISKLRAERGEKVRKIGKLMYITGRISTYYYYDHYSDY